MCARYFYVALATSLIAAAAVAGTPVEFTIDSSRSTVTLLGAIGTDSFQPLEIGSSTARYQGSFFGELEGDLLTIEGGGADAVRSGNTDDPPYELVADAFRGDVLLSILSINFNAGFDSRSPGLSISEGTFPGHLVRFFIGDGTLKFFAPGFIDPDFVDLHGRGAPNTTQREGTIVTNDGFHTITVPFDMAVPFSLLEENDTILTFSGHFVATAPVPEPGSAVLAIGGAAAFLNRRRLRQRSAHPEPSYIPHDNAYTRSHPTFVVGRKGRPQQETETHLLSLT